MRNDMIAALPDARGEAVKDILGGMDKAEAFKRHKLRAPGKQAVEKAIKELEEVKDWGVEDYVTHAERGDRTNDETGTTVAVAETRCAVEKARAYVEKNPDSNLTITTEFDPGAPMPTPLSGPSYWKMIGEIKRQTEMTATEAQKLARRLAPAITIKPTTSYAKFLQKRHDVLMGEENVFDILDQYIGSMWKKHELDPLLKEAKQLLGTDPKTGEARLPKGVRDIMEQTIKDVKGQYYAADQVMDALTDMLGGLTSRIPGKVGEMLTAPLDKGFSATRLQSQLHAMFASLKLGYRPVSVLINRLGGMACLDQDRLRNARAENGCRLKKAKPPFTSLKASWD
jgi:hypothetical protein